MLQKYEKYTFVNVQPQTINFRRETVVIHPGFVGIVDYTYAEKYGGNNFRSYCVYSCKINRNREVEVDNHVSWYQENQLELNSYQNKEKAKELVDAYESKRK